MTVMGAIISPMNVNISSGHSSSEEHIEELLGGDVGFETARVVVVMVAATRRSTLRLGLVSAV